MFRFIDKGPLFGSGQKVETLRRHQIQRVAYSGRKHTAIYTQEESSHQAQIQAGL